MRCCRFFKYFNNHGRRNISNRRNNHKKSETNRKRIFFHSFESKKFSMQYRTYCIHFKTFTKKIYIFTLKNKCAIVTDFTQTTTLLKSFNFNRSSTTYYNVWRWMKNRMITTFTAMFLLFCGFKNILCKMLA